MQRCVASSLTALCAALLLAVLGARAQQLAPPPAGTRSVEVTEEGAIVLRAPAEGAPRRGLVRAGTRMPFVRRFAGAGCPTGVWVQSADEAFLCESSVRYAPGDVGGVAQPTLAPGALLPFDYAFVARDGAHAFSRMEDFDSDDYVESLGEGFGIAVREYGGLGGERFARTQRGLWVSRDDLRWPRGSEFEGVHVDSAETLARVAWVVRARAEVRLARGARRAGRLERVEVERVERGRVVLVDGGSIAARDVARPTLAARPEGVGDAERWIDVDVRSQTLVAYAGDRPTFATLVSTGRPGASTETPLGTHRIWVKLATSDMDDLEREDVEQNYAIEAVPWVQYFQGSNGLHAAFWHDDFGRARSHGCVNLSPRDARTVFELSSPALPLGWTAVLPTERDRGTVVRVR